MSASYPSLEVVASYQGTVVDVQHLRPSEGGFWTWLGLGPAAPKRYTVGEGEGASLAAPPVDLLTPDGFELARIGSGGARWVRFTADMEGEIEARGRRYSLREWIEAGWALPDDGALGTTLPLGARCRLRHGDLVFHLAAVECPRMTWGRPDFDGPFWAICGGTFVLLGSLLILAQMAMPSGGDLDLEEQASENRFVGYFQRPDVTARRTPSPSPPAPAPTPGVAPTAPPPPKVVPPVPTTPAQPFAQPEFDAVASPSTPARAVPRKVRGGGRSRAARIHAAIAADMMRRGRDPIAEARSAGILAFVDTRSHFDNEHAKAFSPDADDSELWESRVDPMERSVGGLGLIGKGRGGGAGSTDDLVESKPGTDAGSRDADRGVVVRAGTATVRGPRARDAVRSVVVRNVRALRRCYDKGVDRDPDLGGTITLKLHVDASGDVVEATASRFADPAVSDCMANAAKGWRFPEVERSGRSRVSIPLTLRLR